MWTDDRKLLRAVLLLAAALAFYQYGLRDLTYFDEPRYAGIAREMNDARSYAIPLLFGETYTEKPPLFFWIAMLAGRMLGFTSWAYFLGNVVAHFLTTLLVLDLGKRFLSVRAGAFAALGFVACPFVLHYARSAQLDPLLSFGITLTAWGALRALAGAGLLHCVLAAFGFAIASLVKGHIALFGLIPPLTWCFVHRDFRAFHRPLRLLACAVIALAPFGVWFALVVREIGFAPSIELYLKKQLVERTAGGNHSSPVPIGPEYVVALAAMLPLTMLAARALRLRGATPNLRVIAVSALAIFAIFAVVPSKRELYLLPLAPYLALLAGDHVARLASGERSLATWERRAMGFLIVVFALAGPAVVVVAGITTNGLANPRALGVDGPLLVVAGLYFSWRTFSAWRNDDRSTAGRLLLQVAVVMLFAEPTLARAANARFGWPEFGKRAQESIPEGETVIVYDFSKAHAAQYYTRRRLEFVDDVGHLIDRLDRLGHGKTSYVITRAEGAKELKRLPGYQVKKIVDDGKEFEAGTMLYAVDADRAESSDG